jgi:hypothetical protein
MDESTNKAVFNLMQNIIDGQDEILNKLNKKGEVHYGKLVMKEVSKLTDFNEQILLNQASLAKNQNSVEEAILSNLKEVVAIPSVSHNYEYSFIGKDPSIKPKRMLFIAVGFTAVMLSAMYIPPFFIEKNHLKEERENYEMFYRYLVSVQFERYNKTYADKILDKIKSKDSLFMDNYNRVTTIYDTEVRKQQLKEELMQLESDGK